MEEQENETHLNESCLKTTYLRRITKGRVEGRWRWDCYFVNSHIYSVSTDSNKSREVTTQYTAVGLWCAENKAVLR